MGGGGGVGTYVEFLWRWTLLGSLRHALLDHILEDLGECLALRQPWRGLVHDLLEEVEDTRWGGVAVREVLAGVEGELADGELHDGEAETPHI